MSGKINWTTVYGAASRFQFPPAIGNGVLFLGAGASLQGFSSSNGAPLFSTRVASTDRWAPTFADGKLYSWTRGNFTEHSPVTGEAVWSLDVFKNNSDPRSTEEGVAVIANGFAYLPTTTSGLYPDAGIQVVNLLTHTANQRFGDFY